MQTHSRNLFLVVLARFTSRLGGTAVWFIGTWGTAAYVFDATPAQLAVMSGVNGVAAIAGSLIAGVLIDRFGPRRVMIGAEILSIPAVLAMMYAPTFAIFVACSAAFSLVGIPTWTAGASFAPYVVKGRAALERANSFIEGGSAVGFVLGTGIGALVSGTIGMRWVFVLMMAASVVAATAAFFIRIDDTQKVPSERGAWRDFTDGLRLAYSSRAIRYVILTGTAVWFGFGAFSALEPLFYRDVVGVDVQWIGWMNMAYGLGLATGASLLPRLPGGFLSARGLAFLTFLTGLGTVLYVGSTDLRLIAVGALVWGAMVGALEPLLRTLLHVESPHEYVGRIVGTAQWHRSLGELMPLAFVPALAATLGIQQTLIAGGLLVAVLAVAGARTARSIDREREHTPPPSAFSVGAGEPTVPRAAAGAPPE